MGRARDAGLRLIFDLDDYAFDPATNDEWVTAALAAVGLGLTAEQRGAMKTAGRAGLAALLALVGAVDRVTAATARVAAHAAPYVRPGVPIAVVPHAIRAALYDEAHRGASGGAMRLQGTEGRIALGWCGTPRPNYEVEVMAEAWGRLARRFPALVFVTITCAPSILARHVPPGRLVVVPHRESHKWFVQALASCDIGCCPVADGPFNRCRSPQKAWEWALTGSPVVCSPTVYGDPEIHPGFEANGGLIAHDVDEWEAHLTRLVEDREERRARVKRLVPWILRDHSIETQWPRWPAAWREIVAHRS